MKYKVTLNNKTYEVEVEKGQATVTNEYDAFLSTPKNETVSNESKEEIKTETTVASGNGEALTAPLPGTVVDIKVTAGQSVKNGDVIVIIEAMKMENEIRAPRDAKINSISVTKNQSVKTGEALVYLG